MPDPADLDAPGRRPGTYPTTLRLAVAVLALEAVALAGLVGYLVYAAVSGDSGTVRGALMVILYTAVMAAIVGALAFALGRGRGAARGPAIVLQILLVPLGGYLLSGGHYLVGVATLLAGLVGVAALLSAATREALAEPTPGAPS